MPTVRDLRQKTVEANEAITMLAAYDAPTAAILDEQGIDGIIVGDSMGNAVLGHDSTFPVTFEEVASRTAAVARATEDALVIADMPFLSYGVDESESIENAGRLLKEAGADAVKIESGPHTVELTRKLTDLGIPVMGHVGLTPQRVNQLGGFLRQGTTKESAQEILDLARQHEEAGAFALILEHMPANADAQITDGVDIPTIGIGAGPNCDGQVLVLHDVIGVSDRVPPFAKQFGDVEAEIESAVSAYMEAVTNGMFPDEEHSYIAEELDEIY
jgi:3-methyl-2-oxobutanoate hydroxymethyltransferase